VDQATNSLVVMAPAPLLDEILQLITRLDEAAEQNPARNLKIIPLQKASASRIEAALQRILHSRPSRSARP
jgi:type II secretory pathway component GspD/PulD (secretin)